MNRRIIDYGGTPKDYQTFLTKQNYSPSSSKSYIIQADKFIQWLIKRGYALQHFDYKQALQYVSYLQYRHSNIKTINHKIISVKHYFEYQMARSSRADNPFADITIKGEKRKKMLTNLLSDDELEDLYYSYETDNTQTNIKLANKRNKVMIGLMVYQGLSTSDMKRLQLEHLKLYQGKIYIPKGRIGNRRELNLKPWQVIEFMEYINEARPEIVKRRKIISEHLFIVSKNKLTDTVSGIIKKLKRINHKVENLHQLRSSVIVNWLDKYNLREVQIMAGHKSISTTERYVQEDLKQLQEVINNYHPLT